MTTKIRKTHQFPSSTSQNVNFLDLCKLFAGTSNKEIKAYEILSKVSFKLQNCQTVLKNHPDFVQKRQQMCNSKLWQGAEVTYVEVGL